MNPIVPIPPGEAQSAEREGGHSESDRIFLAVALWLCAAGAAFLLLTPAAFARRSLTMHAESEELVSSRAWAQNIALERWRDALKKNPSAIENEARKLGFGRAGEKFYPLTAAEWKAARTYASRSPEERSWLSAPSRAVLPALMLILLGTIAVLFFTGLKVPDPNERGGSGARTKP